MDARLHRLVTQKVPERLQARLKNRGVHAGGGAFGHIEANPIGAGFPLGHRCLERAFSGRMIGVSLGYFPSPLAKATRHPGREASHPTSCDERPGNQTPVSGRFSRDRLRYFRPFLAARFFVAPFFAALAFGAFFAAFLAGLAFLAARAGAFFLAGLAAFLAAGLAFFLAGALAGAGFGAASAAGGGGAASAGAPVGASGPG